MSIFIVIAFISGLLLSNQSPINTHLGYHAHSPFVAASLSFAIGTVFLAILTYLQIGHLFPAMAFVTSQPAWIWLGGGLGAIFLTSTILLFPRIGAVKTVVLPVVGQISMGLAIDTFGWFGSKQTPFLFLQLVGVIIMFTGLFLTVLTKKDPSKDTQGTTIANTLPWMIWAVFIGALGAMQQAINGRLGTLLHSPTQAAFISFGIGLILIVIATMCLVKSWPTISDIKKAEPWTFMGGILGALFVLANAVTVPYIGTGLTVMMALIGQLIGSIFVQQFGWWHSIKSQVKGQQIIGILVMLVGIYLIKM